MSDRLSVLQEYNRIAAVNYNLFIVAMPLSLQNDVRMLIYPSMFTSFCRRCSIGLSIFLLIILSACSNTMHMPQHVKDGVLDLRASDFLIEEMTSLDGSWKFLKGGNETGMAEGSQVDGPWQAIEVPKNWNDIVAKGAGYGWYRCKVLLPENIPPSETADLAIVIEGAYTAYTLYINGKTAASAGTAGNTAADTVPQLINRTARLGLTGPEKSFDIVIKVSNFHHARGGLRSSLIFGSHAGIQRSLWIRNMFDVFILGIILMMAVNQFAFWAGRKNELSLLTFSGLCIFFCMRVIARNNYLAQLFPEYHLFELRYIMEYLSITIGCIFLTHFSRRLFPQESSRYVTRTVTLCGILISVFLLATPCSFYSRYVNIIFVMIFLSCIWVIASASLAVKRKRNGALLILFGFIIFTLTILNDILLSKSMVFTANISHVGLAVMVFTQSVVLSFRYKTAIETETRNRDLERELVIARKIQQKLLPRIAPETEGMNMHMICLPMDQVGGDFYDYSTNDLSVSFFIADVSGHGLASSFLSLITKTALSNAADREDTLGIMKYLNRTVIESAVNSQFVTAFYCVIDRKNMSMRYTRAGHPPALLYRHNDDRIIELSSKGYALGIIEDYQGDEQIFQLVTGDRVIMYTDGITECMDDNKNFFGEKRLIHFIRTHSTSSPQRFSEELINALKRYSGRDQFNDDLTLLVIDIVQTDETGLG